MVCYRSTIRCFRNT